jgi:hypothetical protein
MNLYRFTSGSYSDYSERWFAHPEKMTEAELKALLLRHVPAIRAELEAWEVRKEVAAHRLFGVCAADVGWEWQGGRVRRVMNTPRGTAEEYDTWTAEFPYEPTTTDKLFAAAGFVEIEALVTFDEGDGLYQWRQQLDWIEQQASK